MSPRGPFLTAAVPARYVGELGFHTPSLGTCGMAYAVTEEAMPGHLIPWMFVPYRASGGYYVDLGDIELLGVPA